MVYPQEQKWVKGVNVGGWLVMERYIVPYQYAITDCHLQGDLCWYPGALSAPSSHDSDYKVCDFDKCKPALFDSIYGYKDFPMDEWHLAAAFNDTAVAEKWFNHHFENFIKRDDLILMKKAGITHLRVPLPHWVLGNIESDEPWIQGDRWKYFLRLCKWARELDLEVWPSLHTAPGSQNGFDNSGAVSLIHTCTEWANLPYQVQRTLDALDEITARLAHDNLMDVVTGFGLLNEPYFDCNMGVYKQFMDDALAITRSNLGDAVEIFVSDTFRGPQFNDGSWWLGDEYANTLLDTHFYHVFDPGFRSMSPKEHITQICDPVNDHGRITSCCYEDAPNNTIRSKGVQRITTEWSAAFDCTPDELLKPVMQGIVDYSIAPDFYRQISTERKAFLKKFVESQIVAYEAADDGVSRGWFYWTIKVEGGAFAEWDFSRGIKEGWIPTMPPANVPSQTVFGTCHEILNKTEDNMDVVHPFPTADDTYWINADSFKRVDVVSSGVDKPDNLAGTMLHPFLHGTEATSICLMLAIIGVVIGAIVAIVATKRHRNWQYSTIGDVGSTKN